MKTLLIDDLRNLPADRICRTYADGLSALENEGPWDLLLLDHDLGEEDGKDGTGIINWLDEHREFMPKAVKCVSSNPVGRERIEKTCLKIYREME